MNQLSADEYKMTAVNCIYNLCSGMASVFMNVYLYIYTGSLVMMALYTAIRIAMFPPFFTLAGKIADRHSFSHTLTIGLCLLAVQLSTVLFFNSRFGESPWLIYIVASIYGIGEGFFWCSVTSLNQLVSSEENRAAFLSTMGVFNNITSIIAPMLAGFIIAISQTDTEGYLAIFKVVLAVYIVLIFVAFQVKAKARPMHFNVMSCLKLSSKNERELKWQINSISTILFGFNNSLALMLTGLLIYNATGGSGSIYSGLLSVFALLTILSYLYCSKRMKKTKIVRYYSLSSFWLASSTIALVLVPNLFGALYQGISNAMATPFYSNAYSLIGMDAIGAYETDENITGRVIARETFLSVGRCAGMGMIVLASKILPGNLYLPVSVVCLSLFSVAASQYVKYAYRKYHLS
jgi:YQGE family putative transporter